MIEDIRVGALHLRFLRSKHDTKGSLDMFEMTCPPNARMPVPYFHRDWEEIIYGLFGVVMFMVGGVLVDIGAADTVHIPRGVVHGFDNRGSVPARCLCVLTPGILGPEYFRELAAAIVPGAPPDPQVMQEIMTRHGLIAAPQP
jgi:mannose-6-phosphate isomerase-like protein (cupin superfamily)